MTTGQAYAIPMYCPRCGGPMYKPANSPFYWHATSDHRPCTITNIPIVAESTTAKENAEKKHS